MPIAKTSIFIIIATIFIYAKDISHVSASNIHVSFSINSQHIIKMEIGADRNFCVNIADEGHGIITNDCTDIRFIRGKGIVVFDNKNYDCSASCYYDVHSSKWGLMVDYLKSEGLKINTNYDTFAFLNYYINGNSHGIVVFFKWEYFNHNNREERTVDIIHLDNNRVFSLNPYCQSSIYQDKRAYIPFSVGEYELSEAIQSSLEDYLANIDEEIIVVAHADSEGLRGDAYKGHSERAQNINTLYSFLRAHEVTKFIEARGKSVKKTYWFGNYFEIQNLAGPNNVDG